MPRVRIVDRKKLTAYPELASQNGAVQATPEQLKSMMMVQPPATDLYRTKYGRQLNLDRIQNALEAANVGYMRDLTDLGREMIALDPHLSAVVSKRVNAVSSAPFNVEEATGPGVDAEKAKLYAQVVREQLDKVSHFRQTLKQLAFGIYDGRAAVELQWVMRPGGTVNYFLANAGFVHPRRLQFGPERELRIADNLLGGYAAFASVGLALRDIPYKFAWFTPQLFGEYPEREGLVPRCLYWSFFKRFGARDRMILLELFGKPWRIVSVDEESSADDIALRDAQAAADQLGGPSTSARMPRGTKLEVVQVGNNAGQVHADVIAESDRQISKLVLGQTGTTDPMPGALGGGKQSDVMQDEQTLILNGDCELLSDAVEDCVTDAIIALNFGPSEVAHAPRFRLRPEPIRDRKEEAERVKAALEAGLPVALDEAYQIIGLRKPTEDESRIEMLDGGGLVPQRVPTIVAGKEDAERLGKALKEINSAGGGDPSAMDPNAQQDPNAPPNAAAPANDQGDAGLLNKSDMKLVVKVNEARKSAGLPDLKLPDGTKDPDGELTVAAYDAKQKAKQEVTGTAAGEDETGKPAQSPPSPPPAPIPPPGAPQDPNAPAPPAQAPPEKNAEPPKPKAQPQQDDERTPAAAAASRDELKLASERLIDSVVTTLALAAARDCSGHARAVNLEKLIQPSSAYGSLEDLIDKGAAEGARVAQRWVNSIASATEGKTTRKGILDAVKGAVERLDLRPFARSVERRLVHSIMVGALDSDLEGDRDEAIAPSALERAAEGGHFVLSGGLLVIAELARVKLAPQGPAGGPGDEEEEDDEDSSGQLPEKQAKPAPSFSKSPYRSALKSFSDKQVMSKSLFSKLETSAKQRAFTVAGLASDHALEIAKSELMNAIAEGTELKDFASRLRSRFESAGFSVPNKSHLETVFRTNLLGAYNAGRKAQMSQPDVVAARPFWRILTVPDARRRETHGAVHGWVLRASDPFWTSKGGPPWGFNCRCRVYSLSAQKAKAYEIHLGSEIRALPDEGFDAEVAYTTK